MPHVQLFAYEIDTHNQDVINAALRARGADPDEMTQEQYFTLQANLQRDFIVSQVVPQISDGVLPVFLAPEFFFKWRDDLPYDRTAFFNSIDYLMSLSAAYPEVLWVLGTVWWQEPHCPGQVMVHNSALILQKGKLLHSWQKERLSEIDGLTQGPEVWDRWDLAETRILEETQNPFFTADIPGGGSLSCGIEICLDHLTLAGPPVSVGVLRNLYSDAHPNPDQGAGVDLHILTAAGMPIQPENIVARSEGVFLRCDGGNGANPRSNSVTITRVGSSPSEALRMWSPMMTPAVVQTRSSPNTHNRVTTYAPVALG